MQYNDIDMLGIVVPFDLITIDFEIKGIDETEVFRFGFGNFIAVVALELLG